MNDQVSQAAKDAVKALDLELCEDSLPPISAGRIIQRAISTETAALKSEVDRLNGEMAKISESHRRLVSILRQAEVATDSKAQCRNAEIEAERWRLEAAALRQTIREKDALFKALQETCDSLNREIQRYTERPEAIRKTQADTL